MSALDENKPAVPPDLIVKDDPAQDPLQLFERLATLTAMNTLVKAMTEAPTAADRMEAATRVLRVYGKDKPPVPVGGHGPTVPGSSLSPLIFGRMLTGLGETIQLAAQAQIQGDPRTEVEEK